MSVFRLGKAVGRMQRDLETAKTRSELHDYKRTLERIAAGNWSVTPGAMARAALERWRKP
jgi:hypothetical protein